MAREVLRSFWDRWLPVDPVRLAEALEARVIRDPELGELSGSFQLEPTPTIRVKSTLLPMEQRFVVAHALGHYVLSHGTSFTDPVDHFSTDTYDPNELEANLFATELLMPKETVDRAIMRDNLLDIADLAKRFDVSQAAVKYRLKRLGWISR